MSPGSTLPPSWPRDGCRGPARRSRRARTSPRRGPAGRRERARRRRARRRRTAWRGQSSRRRACGPRRPRRGTSKRTPTWCPSATARTKAASRRPICARPRAVDTRRCLRCGTPTSRFASRVDLYGVPGKASSGASASRCRSGRLALTPDEAADAASELGGPVVVKAQVLTGGRGKAGGDQARREPRRRARRPQRSSGSTSAATS